MIIPKISHQGIFGIFYMESMVKESYRLKVPVFPENAKSAACAAEICNEERKMKKLFSTYIVLNNCEEKKYIDMKKVLS